MSSDTFLVAVVTGIKKNCNYVIVPDGEIKFLLLIILIYFFVS